MTFLVDAYDEDEAPNTKGGVDKRTVLRLDPRLAPVKVAVLPLSRNADLSPKATDLATELRRSWNVDFDDSGAIGRRYRRQDEIGTPYCVTVDFETLDDDAVTVRERDTMPQERVPLDGDHVLLRRAFRRLLMPVARAQWPGDSTAGSRRRSPRSCCSRPRALLAGCSDDDKGPDVGRVRARAGDLRRRRRRASPTEPSLPVPEGVELTAAGQPARGRRHRDRRLRAAPGRRRRPRHHGHPAGEDVVQEVVRRLGPRPGPEEGEPLLRARHGHQPRRDRPRRPAGRRSTSSTAPTPWSRRRRSPARSSRASRARSPKKFPAGQDR